MLPLNPFTVSNQNNDCISSIYPRWEFSHITLKVKNLQEIRTHFRSLLRVVPSNWIWRCEQILAQKNSPLCQYALRNGQIPKPLRGALWSYVLGSYDYLNVSKFFV